MPKEQLPDFDDIVAEDFSIGGNPNKVMAVSDAWEEKVKELNSAAHFLSDEYWYKIFEHFDERAELQATVEALYQQLADLARSYTTVSDSIFSYFMSYGQAFLDMKDLAELESFDDYEALVAAIDDYNVAEAAVLAARKNVENSVLSSTSDAEKTTCKASLETAEWEQQQAEKLYQARFQAWNKQLAKGQQVKNRLGEDVGVVVKLIKEAELEQ